MSKLILYLLVVVFLLQALVLLVYFSYSFLRRKRDEHLRRQAEWAEGHRPGSVVEK